MDNELVPVLLPVDVVDRWRQGTWLAGDDIVVIREACSVAWENRPPTDAPDDPRPDDLLYDAWTIIANAYHGNWDEDPEWKEAATRWRDRWLKTLRNAQPLRDDRDLRSTIGQALGEVSMCWDPIPTGVFDSERAGRVADDLCRAVGILPDPSAESAPEPVGCRVLDALNQRFTSIEPRYEYDDDDDDDDDGPVGPPIDAPAKQTVDQSFIESFVAMERRALEAEAKLAAGCSVCGVTVADPDLHREWHHELRTAVRKSLGATTAGGA